MQLSRDHKPDDPLEKEYILARGGRIDSYRDRLGNQVGPMRVWLKYEDTPGLAMSRSFGDSVACKAGVHAVPEIRTYELQPNDKVIVLASDGIWEFLSNQRVASLILPFIEKRNAEAAAETIIREAFRSWKREEQVIDDITCVILFLDV